MAVNSETKNPYATNENIWTMSDPDGVGQRGSELNLGRIKEEDPVSRSRLEQ